MSVIDIPGVYLHVDINEYIIVKSERKMVEILKNIDSKIYEPYVEINHSGKKILYTKLRKVLHGCLRSGLLVGKI